MTPIPPARVRRLNHAPERPEGAYVLYWMGAARRTTSSFALQHAVSTARRLSRPLVVYEGLSAGHPWAAPRFHAFVAAGMHQNAQALAAAGVTAVSWIEPEPGAGAGLLDALAAPASVVVVDDYPCDFLPRWTRRFAARCPAAVEAVDGHGLVPLLSTPHAFPTAHAFRRHLQRTLRAHLAEAPVEHPLVHAPRAPAVLPDLTRWPGARTWEDVVLHATVGPVTGAEGGPRAAHDRLERFLDRLDLYATHRNDPAVAATSGLSPALHFGHIDVHTCLRRLQEREGWTPARLSSQVRGDRAGWWGMSPAAESWLDELITWRELGAVYAHHHPDLVASVEGLPNFARTTLRKHASDARPWRYDLATLESAGTHDALWNAAQRQLVREGVIHNTLRMLWGKKVLEWTESPEQAADWLVHLNNTYALDGRDPNSYSGIFWTLGRFDRAWGPERPIFGTVRFMSSQNTARKLNVRPYLERYGP